MTFIPYTITGCFCYYWFMYACLVLYFIQNAVQTNTLMKISVGIGKAKLLCTDEAGLCGFCDIINRVNIWKQADFVDVDGGGEWHLWKHCLPISITKKKGEDKSVFHLMESTRQATVEFKANCTTHNLYTGGGRLLIKQKQKKSTKCKCYMQRNRRNKVFAEWCIGVLRCGQFSLVLTGLLNQ